MYVEQQFKLKCFSKISNSSPEVSRSLTTATCLTIFRLYGHVCCRQESLMSGMLRTEAFLETVCNSFLNSKLKLFSIFPVRLRFFAALLYTKSVRRDIINNKSHIPQSWTCSSRIERPTRFQNNFAPRDPLPTSITEPTWKITRHALTPSWETSQRSWMLLLLLYLILYHFIHSEIILNADSGNNKSLDLRTGIRNSRKVRAQRNLLCFLLLLYRMLPSISIHLYLSLCLTLVFNPIPKPSSLVSWSQICLLNSIAVFETMRSYQ